MRPLYHFEDVLSAAVDQINSEYDGKTDSEELLVRAKNLLALQERNVKSISVKGTKKTFTCRVICALPSTLNDFIEDYSSHLCFAIHIKRFH